MSVRMNTENEMRLQCMIYHKDIPIEYLESMDEVRQRYVDLAEMILKLCPEGRSKSLALTYLEESLTRAIQSLALKGKPDLIYVERG